MGSREPTACPSPRSTPPLGERERKEGIVRDRRVVVVYSRGEVCDERDTEAKEKSVFSASIPTPRPARSREE